MRSSNRGGQRRIKRGGAKAPSFSSAKRSMVKDQVDRQAVDTWTPRAQRHDKSSGVKTDVLS